MNFDGTAITGAYELPYRRDALGATAVDLMFETFTGLLEGCGLSRDDIDGLGCASFSLKPDNAIDVAWQLGLTLNWLMEDNHGGACGINLLSHAVRAIQAGDARAIVLLAADIHSNASTANLNDTYSTVVRDHLAPLPYGGPNSLFALLTDMQMRQNGLTREDYAKISIAQREWAALNPKAVYRSPMTLENYRDAPIVAAPLGRFDCVPIVSGGDAILVTRDDMVSGASVRLRALRSRHNYDQQLGDGLQTGLSRISDQLWRDANLRPEDMDVVSVYDDYPCMVLAQLMDLGFLGGRKAAEFIAEDIATRKLALNTSGGQLSVGQAGAAGGLHGLVEVVTQLLGQAGDRQVDGAQFGLASGYGMIQYRYCQCANAVVLERSA